MGSKIRVVLCALLLVSLAHGVRWNKCQDTFCKRLRGGSSSGDSNYVLRKSTLHLSSVAVEGRLQNIDSSEMLQFNLHALDNDTFRIYIDEIHSEHPRLRPLVALKDAPSLRTFGNYQIKNGAVVVKVGDNTAVVYLSDEYTEVPLKVEFYKNDQLVSVVNSNNLLTFETQEPNVAVGLDISFPGAQRAYGIPEHSERLSLRTTRPGGWDPYRLFNIDHYAWAVESPEAIYGAVPVLYAHSPQRTSGVFWLNAAQTWVEITNGQNQVDAHFMSESGTIDLFVFMGPTLKETVQQYAQLTGTAPLPQYFAISYHQSRYSYFNQTDVVNVVAEFDKHDLPVDVLWLDIDYTDEKKYFTWNPENFSDPIAMQKNLSSTNRKIVGVIDPHIKVEEGYFLYDDAIKYDYFVKNPNGSVFEGQCFSGLSSYLDFLNPEVVDYYASLYSFKKFQGSTEDLYIWNDMNEPSVFDKAEQTIPLDVKHIGGYLHRDMHNMYGFLQSTASYKGLLARSNRAKRPFVLTRSHFPGSQRYAAMWTGDNVANWDYLNISIPMCLTEALAGISFCGADVGGFVGYPDNELYQRWYQVGAWLPFFRAHSAVDTPRREPFLYSEKIQQNIRNVLRQRYAHLPEWYTLWWEHSQTGEPVIRPLTYQYPQDRSTLDIDSQYLVGENILVSPVLAPDVQSIQVYLPGGHAQKWYNLDNDKLYSGTGYQSIPVTLESVPVFYRAGGVIVRKDVPRRSSVDTYNDPYTIYIVADQNQYANGSLYIDDYESFNYKRNEYLYVSIEYSGNYGVQVSKIHPDAHYNGAAPVGSVVIINPPSNVRAAQLIDTRGGVQDNLQVSYNSRNTQLVISNFSGKWHRSFQIKLLY